MNKSIVHNHAQRSVTIVPAILTGSIEVAQQQLDIVKGMAEVDQVQIDVIDGWFADNLTITPTDLLELDWGRLQIDLHLMVDEPMDFVFEALEFKDRLPIQSVIGQIEHMSSQTQFVEQVRSVGWQPGLALDLYTPLESVDREVWGDVHLLQIMGIEAGFQGQEFVSQALEVVKDAHQLRQQQQAEWEICVDGGVKASNITRITAAGATLLVVGSALWAASDPTVAYAELSQLVAER